MKTILITGASSGIGRAAAKHFSKQGWNVIATMRSPELETELTQLEQVWVTKLDVVDKETILQTVTKGIEIFGTIDVLLNNAGYGTMGIFEAATEEQIHRQFEINVFGLMRMTKAILPHFRANKSGVIINISSMGGKITFPTMSLYHASKFAVEGFSESLSFELASQNIKVKLIEPGMVNTDFGGRSMELFDEESIVDYEEYLTKAGAAFGTIGGSPSSPESIAEVIYEAATDGTNQLRYVAGDDAKTLLQQRKESDDAVFLKQLSEIFS